MTPGVGGPPPLERPLDVGVIALGGADLWSGGGGPALELRGGFEGASATGGFWRFGSSTEVLGATGGPYLFDLHHGALGWSGRGVLSGVVQAQGLGSAGTGWAEADALGGVRWLLGDGLRISAIGGPLVRLTTGGSAPGLLGSVAVEASGRLLTSVSRVQVRALAAPLPPWLLQADQWVGIGDRVRVEVGALGTWSPPSTALAVPGQPSPGTVALQGGLAGEVALGRRLALRAETGPEVAWGTSRYTRVRAFAGLRARLGRLPAAPPAPVDDAVRFELRAPEAEQVELLASFNDWTPLPMARGRSGRFVLDVDVPPGTWEFVYVVDGRVITPPAARSWTPDGFGGTNGVVTVE